MTYKLPAEEKFGMIVQISRGASGKSETERKRYYGVASGSVIEIDAALDIADNLGYLQKIEIQNLGRLTVDCFKVLTGIINPRTKNH